PQDAALLRCLGRLCLRDQLWGKARGYLQESQRLRPHPVTALALAQLAEATGQGEEAQQHYRAAALGLAELLQSREQLAQGRAVRGAAREAAASEPLA
ncbi:MAG: hypothetical protein N3D71_14530, partial [Burkholderiaceae bacterium]|nr:hypothetical protein [Burkholderiaceae bacterium]